MPSFDELASVTASTKRSGGIVDGLEVGYVEEIASLKCLPLDPVDPNLSQVIKGLAWYELLQTYVQGGLDIVEGDILVMDSEEYPIQAVSNWEWKGSEYKTLLLEDKK